jgi:fructosamine-3-kinase
MDPLAEPRGAHPLLAEPVTAAIRQAASAHWGRPWTYTGFTSRDDRAAHPCGIFHAARFSVFAKLTTEQAGRGQFEAEMSGRDLIARRSAVRTPTPVAEGVVEIPGGSLLLLEALAERTGPARTDQDFAAIGAALATLHQVTDLQFGLASDGFFGPLPQHNRPVSAASWTDFYAERRVEPMLRAATDSGNLPATVRAAVSRLLPRLGSLGGDDPVPSLLHGDAQQNNFMSTPDGPVAIDTAPYFGHPELDLALIDYFAPVPPATFDGYRDVRPIDREFGERRELWRIFAYLAVIACDGQNPFGRSFISRLADAAARYA